MKSQEEMALSWQESLANVMAISSSDLLSQNYGEVLKRIFEGCVEPGLSIADDASVLSMPECFEVKIKGCEAFHKLFKSNVFQMLPLHVQKGTLDILNYVLCRSVHDVARFRYPEEGETGIIGALLVILRDILDKNPKTIPNDELLIAKRIVRLIGVLAVCGISTPELKAYLSFLKFPSMLSISLLQALKSMMAVDNSIVKAFPLSFFDFNWSKAGLSILPYAFPFQKEYQVSFWFRVENSARRINSDKMELFSFMNDSSGVMIYIENDLLCVSVSSGPTDSAVVTCAENPIFKGIWYHVCLTHNKPRMALFAKHEMTISLDSRTVFQDAIKFPSSPSTEVMMQASIGRNFNGQIGTIYVFNEPLPSSSINTLSRYDAGKPTKEALKKSVMSKVLSVYHPQRCDGNQIIDFHGCHHALLTDDIYLCNIVSVRDTLTSLGGINCLLPLFPTLLIEHEDVREELFDRVCRYPMPAGWQLLESSRKLQRKSSNEGYIPANVGLGTSLYEIMTDESLPSTFCCKTVESFDSSDIFELQDDKVIGLLLFIVARCLKHHHGHLNTFAEAGGVQMISYCLKRIPSESVILKEEDESCVLALLQLRENVTGFSDLEVLVVRELLCNISIWSAASYKFQMSLFSVILANMKAQSSYFLDVFGVQRIVDNMTEFYLHYNGKAAGSGQNTVAYVSSCPSDGESPIVEKLDEGNNVGIGVTQEHDDASFSPNVSTDVAINVDINADTESGDNTSNNDVDSSRMDEGDERPSDVIEDPNNSEVEDVNSTEVIRKFHRPKMKRRSSGSSSFLRSVNRRMSASEHVLSNVAEKIEVDEEVDKRAMFAKQKEEKGKNRSMSVKFSDVPAPSVVKEGLSFSDLALSTDLGAKTDEDENGVDDDFDDNIGKSVTALSSEQRRAIRSVLQSMILVLGLNRGSTTEIEPLFYFLQHCEDNIVLDEISQILLCLVVEDSSNRVVNTILEVFKSPEDFMSFVLNRLDHRPCEPLRCSLYALLVQFYLRAGSLPSYATHNSGSRIKKGSKLYKKREKFSVGAGQSLQRLEACGGLASMCMIMNASKKECGMSTYKTLFGLLFTSPDSKAHINSHFRTMLSENVSNNHQPLPEFRVDESQEVLNPSMLASYFYFAPKLPLNVQENVHVDLLAILKHNPLNRELFRGNIAWHLCVYDLVGQLVVLKTAETTSMLECDKVVTYLRDWAMFQRPEKESALLNYFDSFCKVESKSSPSKISTSTAGADSVNKSSSSNNLEMWFDIGMKTYATMLVHSMDMNGGFVEVQRTASQSFASEHGVAVTLSIFSHLLHELTFTIQSKYKDMQRLSRSTNSEDVTEATSKLENMLSIIVLLSLYLYDNDSVAVMGLIDEELARERVRLVDEVNEKLEDKRFCRTSCTSDTHPSLCTADETKLCESCGHNLSLHLYDKNTVMEIVEEMLSTDERVPSDPASHAWMDLRSGGGYPPMKRPAVSRASSGRSKKNLFSEETLNPLERGYEMSRGKMVVSLQVLRYFDMIFWPEENRLRNGHLLNFDMNSKSSPKKNPKAPSGRSMTMYSGILRISLFVFSGLSPFTEFAEQNVRRLEQLFKVIEQVPSTCPINDWTMTVLAHIVSGLQRIYASIKPMYEILDIEKHFSSTNHDKEGPDEFAMFGDEGVAEKVNDLFNNSAGRQLVQYINSCVNFLVSIYTTRKEYLLATLDDHSFMSLTLLVQNTQNFHFHVSSMKGSISFSKSGDSQRELNQRSVHDLSESPEVYRSSPKGSRHSPYRNASNSSGTRNRQSSVSHFSFDGLDIDCDEKVCEDTMYALYFLRDPFLSLDICKCDSILRGCLNVEKFENECSSSYHTEMTMHQNELMVKRDIIGNCIDEIDELTEIGKEVKRMLASKDSERMSNKSIRDEISTKASATYWNNCLRMNDESWSPWAAAQQDDMLTSYSASVHMDAARRRLVMFRNDENVDYSDAAYFEGKLKDQQDFEDSMSNKSYDNEGESIGSIRHHVSSQSSSLSFMENTLQLSRPKASKLNSTSTTHGDGSDNESDSVEDVEEKTVDVKRNESNIFAMLNTSVEKRPLWALTFNWQADEKEIFSAEVMEIMTEQVLAGTVLLTNRHIYFHPKKRTGGFLVKPDEFRNKRWQLSKLTECYSRRYLLQNCGIELFFSDSPELFFAFNTKKESHRFFRHLKKQSLPSLNMSLSLSPSYIFQHSKWTELWKKRSISNFEYLMRLNIIAGRSYNDITQYPVFPWVLSDYESETLDLSDPKVYRDLSKPVGALNEERLAEILDRYRSFGDFDMPKFMYGSHYSTAGLILHFLIRQEPFTSMAITLQGGRFDCPDRLFFDLKETWKCCNTSMSDVKELIPQLFYFPEAFVNSNSLPLGELQDGRGDVNEVHLPPWCNNDPFEFVRIHREALESEYVSEHLHEWIDLIFGYKQTGPAALEANNVFHYLTYENAIDIESITDPLQRSATKAQVTHFGQTPSQLTTKEHPKRNSLDDCILSFCAFPSPSCFSSFQVYLHPRQCGLNSEHGAVVAVTCSSNQLIVCYSDFTVAYHKWSTVPEANKMPFALKVEKSRVIPSANLSTFYHRLPAKPTDDVENSSPLRSRATSVGEGILAAGSSLFKRGLFSQNEGSKKVPPEKVESRNEASGLANDNDNDNDNDNGGESAANVRDSDTTENSGTDVSDNVIETEENTCTEGSARSGSELKLNRGYGMRNVKNVNGGMPKRHMGTESIRNNHVAIKFGEGGGHVISCGYWNNAVKFHALKDSLTEVKSTSGGHFGQITCLSLGSDQQILISGSTDCTCRVWQAQNSSELKFESCHVLLGHVNPITAVYFSSFHDLVISASANGFLCLHTAQRGKFVRSISTLCTETSKSVDRVGISNAGYLLAHSSEDLSLSVFWINGQHLKQTTLNSSIESWVFNKEGTVVFCGLSSGTVKVLRSWDLNEIYSINLQDYGSITCLKLVSDDQFLFIGSEKGTLHVGTDPETRWKVLTSAISKNPLVSSTLS